MAESFFQLLKRERIKRKTYTTREDARNDVFDYIEILLDHRRLMPAKALEAPSLSVVHYSIMLYRTYIHVDSSDLLITLFDRRFT